MFFQFSNFAQCHVCFSMFCDIFARFGARLLDRDLRIQQPFGLKKSQKSFSVVLNYWFLHRCIKLHLFFFIKLHLFGMNLGWIHIYSGHNGEDIVKIIRAVDSTTNPWLNLAAALLEALSRRRTSKYEPSYNCDKSERTKSIKKPKRQYDLRNLGKHVAHIAYSFPHLFALHALPHLQHMQVSFLATVKAPRDIYIFIGPETGIGYEAGKFSVVCFCMRRVRTFRAKHAKHGWIFDIFRRDPTWWQNMRVALARGYSRDPRNDALAGQKVSDLELLKSIYGRTMKEQQSLGETCQWTRFKYEYDLFKLVCIQFRSSCGPNLALDIRKGNQSQPLWSPTLTTAIRFWINIDSRLSGWNLDSSLMLLIFVDACLQKCSLLTSYLALTDEDADPMTGLIRVGSGEIFGHNILITCRWLCWHKLVAILTRTRGQHERKIIDAVLLKCWVQMKEKNITQ